MLSPLTRFASLVLLISFVLAACTSATTPEPERPPLKIAWSLWPGWYPMAIAIEQGLFEKHGVTVEPVFYESYTAQIPDMLAGKMDGALITLSDALLVDSRQPGSIRVVLVNDNSDGADAIVAAPEITAVADLKGKTVGAQLGSFSELLVSKMLETNGLTTADVILVNIEPETVPDAIPHTIQAGHTWEPFTTDAVRKGYHVLFSSAETPGLIVDVLAVQTEAAQTRPDDVRAFNAAWFETLAWWQANPEAGNAIIAEAIGVKPEEVSAEGVKLFDLNDNQRAFQPGTELTSLYVSGQANIDFLISTGGLTRKPDINQLLDPQFLK